VLVVVLLSKKQKPEFVKMTVSDDITDDTPARFAGQAVRFWEHGGDGIGFFISYRKPRGKEHPPCRR
jgi:hypothetical protein